MSFLRNRLLRRVSFIGRLADLALLGGMALRFAQRKGLVSDENLNQFGLSSISDGESFGIAELALASAAAARLLRRRKK